MFRDLVFWSMADLHYLIEQEREEELRTASRTIPFADGETHRIKTYRLVWRWYDRLCECPYTFDEDEIIAMVPRCSEHEGLDLPEALTRVVAVLVGRLDRLGIDITDDHISIDLARQRMTDWEVRKTGPYGQSG